MNKWFLLLGVFVLAGSANAGWAWPFGDGDDSDQPRLSELMAGATELIDDATELASEGKYQEAVAKYRESLDELAKVERENPERAATTEFASLRNKRAYVNASIDSLLLAEARENAKAVSITDTTELEKKLSKKKGKGASVKSAAGRTDDEAVPGARKTGRQKKSTVKQLNDELRKDPNNRKARLALIGKYLKNECYEEAKKEIEFLLKVNASDSTALNLKSVCEAADGDYASAEKSLDLAIQSNPRDYNGYYNMANLKLLSADNKDIARRYYETGRALGGPVDESLESSLK